MKLISTNNISVKILLNVPLPHIARTFIIHIIIICNITTFIYSHIINILQKGQITFTLPQDIYSNVVLGVYYHYAKDNSEAIVYLHL